MSLESEEKRWEEELLNPALKRYPERKPEFETLSGITMPRLGLPDALDYMQELGFPGEYPFTARYSTHHVPRPPVDYAPICRVCQRRRI